MEGNKVILVDLLLWGLRSLSGLILRNPGLERTLQSNSAAALHLDIRKSSHLYTAL